MKEQKKSSHVTVGLDLGDRRHRFCVLDGAGGMVEEGSVGNDRVSLGGLSCRYPGALMVVEAGCHSPWVSRYLEEQGCRVLVANPRKLRAIYQNERKSDRRDAQMLARIGRLDPALLYPVRHGTAEAQEDLLRLKLRDSLVRARVAVINSVGFTLKSLGYTVRNPASERFHKVALEEVPETLRQMIAPSVQALAELTARIKVLDLEINILAKTKYPQTAQLQQIPGVGPITALYFVLEIEDPQRFRQSARCGRLRRFMSTARPERGERSAVAHLQAGRRLPAPAPGQRLAVYSRSFGAGERVTLLRTQSGGRRKRAGEETGCRGGGAKARGSALEPVEESAPLPSVPAAGLSMAREQRGQTIRNDCDASLEATRLR
jgi:transposase